MAKPASRSQFIDYCKRQLGAPVLEINVAEEQVEDIVDDAIQAHGGGGLSEDFGLSQAYAQARLLRLADGPDEVHRNQIAKLELRKYN